MLFREETIPGQTEAIARARRRVEGMSLEEVRSLLRDLKDKQHHAANAFQQVGHA
jgi:hypothetical protein